MSDRTAEQILQRRRVQNREAQRRFRGEWCHWCEVLAHIPVAS
jgi:hypothetical protein